MKPLEYMQIAVSLDREEGGFLASVSEIWGRREGVRIGQSAAAALQRRANHAAGLLFGHGQGTGQEGQETVRTLVVGPPCQTQVPKVLLRFTTQIPMFMTSLQSDDDATSSQHMGHQSHIGLPSHLEEKFRAACGTSLRALRPPSWAPHAKESPVPVLCEPPGRMCKYREI